MNQGIDTRLLIRDKIMGGIEHFRYNIVNNTFWLQLKLLLYLSDSIIDLFSTIFWCFYMHATDIPACRPWFVLHEVAHYLLLLKESLPYSHVIVFTTNVFTPSKCTMHPRILHVHCKCMHVIVFLLTNYIINILFVIIILWVLNSCSTSC